jgi:nucleotide-binding universal stress UspA family protein
MIDIKRILCPVDFSDHSRLAVDYAKVVARWYGAAITVLHVHQVAVPSFGVGPVVAPQAFVPVVLTDEERGAVLRAIENFVAADRAAGWQMASLVDEAVNVPGAIVSLAGSLPADLVVIGTHGRTGFHRLVLGSVTEKLLRTAPCPVLCVPPHSPDAVRLSEPGLSRVICPVDFSASSARTLRYAASIAEQARARLTVLHVIELAPDAGDVLVPEADVYRAARLENANAAMRDLIAADIRQASAIDEVIGAGRPYQEIMRMAAEQQAGLIVMGVHGRGAVDRMFFGSTTQHVVRQAPCPVLTLRDE